MQWCFCSRMNDMQLKLHYAVKVPNQIAAASQLNGARQRPGCWVECWQSFAKIQSFEGLIRCCSNNWSIHYTLPELTVSPISWRWMWGIGHQCKKISTLCPEIADKFILDILIELGFVVVEQRKHILKYGEVRALRNQCRFTTAKCDWGSPMLVIPNVYWWRWWDGIECNNFTDRGVSGKLTWDCMKLLIRKIFLVLNSP